MAEWLPNWRRRIIGVARVFLHELYVQVDYLESSCQLTVLCGFFLSRNYYYYLLFQMNTTASIATEAPTWATRVKEALNGQFKPQMTRAVILLAIFEANRM